MDVLTAAFYQRLVSDDELTERLATYQGLPAVFTDDRVPGQGSELPWIVTSGTVANEPADTKTSEGRRPFRDIYVYCPHQTTALVEELAERVRVLFHRHRLEVDGYSTVTAAAHGPVSLSADDYDARIVSVRLRLEKDDDDES